MARDYLLEIGTEEIAARFMPGAIAQLRELAVKQLQEKRLDYSEIAVYGTPRRLAVFIKDLAEKQVELVEEAKGPAKKAAFDAEGKPTRAAEGFARGQGVTVADLYVKELNGVEYMHATKREAGKDTVEILPEMTLGFIHGLNFPKPMRWGYKETRFARPIRWLVSLFGAEVVKFDLEGLVSDRVTYGHRFLSEGTIAIAQASDYVEQLRQAGVIVNQEERKQLIWQQIQDTAIQESGQVAKDEQLLEEVTYLLEYPTALCGSFAVDYLQLPKEVLITPMREHQRYFPVVDMNGNLLNKFITVRNGGKEHIEIVREGNEKVLRARLADAKFFYEEDLKTPLANQVDRLQKIVFQEALGTIYQKVERMQSLTQYLAQEIGLEQAQTQDALRGAYLAKADLVTNMVYEFPELQGLMGQEYSAKHGESAGVSKAIYEHYLPRFAGDDLPQTLPGTLVSIADKIDTIVGCFAVGIQPTGSQDPYALRRQALGISHIILAQGLPVSLSALIAKAYEGYVGVAQFKLSMEQVETEVTEFFKQRLKNIFTDDGIRYDIIDAVLSVGFDNFTDAWLRAKALVDLRQQPNFDSLLAAFNRVTNLAKKAESDQYNPQLLQEPVEQELVQTFSQVTSQAQSLLQDKNYAQLLLELSKLQAPVNKFFDGVMVMAEDSNLRNSRLGLLKQIDQMMNQVADLSKIVTD